MTVPVLHNGQTAVSSATSLSPESSITRAKTAAPYIQPHVLAHGLMNISHLGVSRHEEQQVASTVAEANIEPNGKHSAVIFPKKPVLAQDRFVSLQKWEGTVLEIEKNSFIARVTDLSPDSSVEEEAEFPLEEIAESDRPLLEKGAIFYWSIGYLDTLTGQRLRTSALRFRRLPAWTAKELEAARTYTESQRKLLEWD